MLTDFKSVSLFLTIAAKLILRTINFLYLGFKDRERHDRLQARSLQENAICASKRR